MDNLEAARVVFTVASLLDSLGANPYRVRAYRRAAVGLQGLPEPAALYVGPSGELQLPWLGERLRRKLGELVVHGRMQFHDQVMAGLPPPYPELLAVPGIGPRTAERLVDELGVRGIDDVARAAREGRLRTIRGIGPARERLLGQAAESALARAA